MMDYQGNIAEATGANIFLLKLIIMRFTHQYQILF